MRKENDLVLLNISLSSFEGEGGGGATGGEGGVATTTAAPQGNKEPVVIYGKQDDDDGSEGQPNEGGAKQATDTPPDPSAEFEALIKGQYKEQFDARIQAIIDKRFKAAKEAEAKLNQVSPIMQLMMEKYGVKTEAEAVAAYEAEALEELAYKNNMDVDTYRDYRDSKFKAQLYDQHNNQQEWQAQVDQKVADWYTQANAMKEQYPDFDFRSYVNEEPEFLKLLDAGVPVKQAYELLNLDNLKAQAAKQAQANTVKSIQANGSRPREAAAQANNGTIIKSSVGNLTKSDREEIARRAQRGEKIRF